MTFTQRLKSYIDYKGLSLNAFDQSIGTSNGYIGRAIKSNGSLGSEILQKIFSVYSDLNPIWLFTGDGEMLLPQNSKMYNTHDISRTLNEQDVPYHREVSIDDERRTLIDSINKMTETADRNSITLAKIVDYLVSKDVNIE